MVSRKTTSVFSRSTHSYAKNGNAGGKIGNALTCTPRMAPRGTRTKARRTCRTHTCVLCTVWVCRNNAAQGKWYTASQFTSHFYTVHKCLLHCQCFWVMRLLGLHGTPVWTHAGDACARTLKGRTGVCGCSVVRMLHDMDSNFLWKYFEFSFPSLSLLSRHTILEVKLSLQKHIGDFLSVTHHPQPRQWVLKRCHSMHHPLFENWMV